MARYHNIGIQIDAPEELLEGPEDELGAEVTSIEPRFRARIAGPGGESPKCSPRQETPGGSIES